MGTAEGTQGKGRQGDRPPLLVLVVDPGEHAEEIARFAAKLVTPPPNADGTPTRICTFWRGAVADDGYGRFHIVRDGHVYTVRSHRYAAAWRLGIALPLGQVVEHAECDNPICQRADPDPRIGHIWPSTQAENRRLGSRWWLRKWNHLNRAERAERSRQLRDAVRDGWNEAAVREVLLRIHPAQGVLF
jgi:hypothetical protein